MTNRIDHTNCSHPRTPAGRRTCRNARAIPTISTRVGNIRRGSIIVAEVRGGDPERYVVRNVSDDIKNGYPGWDADGRWGYSDQVLQVIKF